MNGRYLLDTNVAIQVLNGQLDLESRSGRGIKLFLCLTVIGELFFGAAKSGKPKANRQRVEALLSLCPVIPQELKIAEHYGDIKARLRKKGRPIPENDIWIAACCRHHSLTLITRDSHFDEVEGLQTEVW